MDTFVSIQGNPNVILGRANGTKMPSKLSEALNVLCEMVDGLNERVLELQEKVKKLEQASSAATPVENIHWGNYPRYSDDEQDHPRYSDDEQ